MSQLLTRRRAMGLTLWAWVGGVLAGCGQKGPLYFPPEPKQAPEEAGREDDKNKNEKESSGNRPIP